MSAAAPARIARQLGRLLDPRAAALGHRRLSRERGEERITRSDRDEVGAHAIDLGDERRCGPAPWRIERLGRPDDEIERETGELVATVGIRRDDADRRRRSVARRQAFEPEETGTRLGAGSAATDDDRHGSSIWAADQRLV